MTGRIQARPGVAGRACAKGGAMPAIFTEADREELRRRMFDAGWDLIVE